MLAASSVFHLLHFLQFFTLQTRFSAILFWSRHPPSKNVSTENAQKQCPAFSRYPADYRFIPLSVSSPCPEHLQYGNGQFVWQFSVYSLQLPPCEFVFSLKLYSFLLQLMLLIWLKLVRTALKRYTAAVGTNIDSIFPRCRCSNAIRLTVSFSPPQNLTECGKPLFNPFFVPSLSANAHSLSLTCRHWQKTVCRPLHSVRPISCSCPRSLQGAPAVRTPPATRMTLS